MTKVKEVMTKNPTTVEASSTVLDAVKLMNQKGFSGLIVVDKGKPAGLISERSLLRRFVTMDRPSGQVRVADVMYKPLPRVDADADVKKAARILLSNRLTRLGVTRNGKLVGVVTLTDLAKVVSKKSLLETVSEKWEHKEELTCPNCHRGTLIQIQETYGPIWRCPKCSYVLD